MSKVLKSVSKRMLEGETIVTTKCGSDLTPSCGSYGAMTLHTKSGREFVVWQSWGEVCVSEVING